MNAQREVVYKRRKHALKGERLKVYISNMVYETAQSIVENNRETKDFKNFDFELIRLFSMSSPVDVQEFETMEHTKLVDQVYEVSYERLQSKTKQSAEQVFPVIKDVYENPANKFERIVVPFTAGKKTLNVVTNLKNAYESEGKQLIEDFEKNISLALIDDSWKENLRKMDELKQSVQ